MLRKLPLLFALLFLLPSGLARGTDGWTRLKLGMTAEEAVAALGAPLFRSEGRGFEMWIYDGRAEVVLYGGVIAWTAPASSPAVRTPVELWEFYQATPNRLKAPFPLRNPALSRPLQAAVPDDAGSGFRYQQRH